LKQHNSIAIDTKQLQSRTKKNITMSDTKQQQYRTKATLLLVIENNKPIWKQ
jgi:hypothetical protein